jgi:hypothetical protein
MRGKGQRGSILSALCVSFRTGPDVFLHLKGMQHGHRQIIALALALLTAGCYRLTPIEGVVPGAGADVRVDLTDAGSVTCASGGCPHCRNRWSGIAVQRFGNRARGGGRCSPERAQHAVEPGAALGAAGRSFQPQDTNAGPEENVVRGRAVGGGGAAARRCIRPWHGVGRADRDRRRWGAAVASAAALGGCRRSSPSSVHREREQSREQDYASRSFGKSGSPLLTCHPVASRSINALKR